MKKTVCKRRTKENNSLNQIDSRYFSLFKSCLNKQIDHYFVQIPFLNFPRTSCRFFPLPNEARKKKSKSFLNKWIRRKAFETASSFILQIRMNQWEHLSNDCRGAFNLERLIFCELIHVIDRLLLSSIQLIFVIICELIPRAALWAFYVITFPCKEYRNVTDTR